MEKKKIGILTYSHTSNMNYGAMLQTYALYSYLKQIGQAPSIIRWNINKKRKLTFVDITDRGITGFTYYLLCLKRLFTFALTPVIEKIFLYHGEKPFANFFYQYIPDFTRIVSIKEMKTLNREFDCFIVGSDQVWRYKICPNIKSFFLDFVEDDKLKVSYAASFGINTWSEAPDDVTSEIKKLICRLNAISVREESGISICKNVFDVEAQLVLDPTLLINREIYEHIIEDDNTPIPTAYVACMLLDDRNHCGIYNNISNITQLECISIKGKSFSLLSKQVTKYNSIALWLKLIQKASFVITDSFHCTVFCILFHKKFAVIKHPSRGISRLETLLSRYGLKEYLVGQVDDILHKKLWNNNIDYCMIENQLLSDRAKSADFLKEALK